MIRPERSALYGENGLLGAIEAALPKRTRGEIRAAIRGGAVDVRPLLAELSKTSPRGMRARGEAARPTALVIAIDQAEELFRVEGTEESAALLALIRDLTAEGEPTVIAIFAIRSDSMTRCSTRSSRRAASERTEDLITTLKASGIEPHDLQDASIVTA